MILISRMLSSHMSLKTEAFLRHWHVLSLTFHLPNFYLTVLLSLSSLDLSLSRFHPPSQMINLC